MSEHHCQGYPVCSEPSSRGFPAIDACSSELVNQASPFAPEEV